MVLPKLLLYCRFKLSWLSNHSTEMFVENKYLIEIVSRVSPICEAGWVLYIFFWYCDPTDSIAIFYFKGFKNDCFHAAEIFCLYEHIIQFLGIYLTGDFFMQIVMKWLWNEYFGEIFKLLLYSFYNFDNNMLSINVTETFCCLNIILSNLSCERQIILWMKIKNY